MTANQINYWRFNEDRRHNEVTEVETSRHNRATEGIGYGQIALGYAQLAETTRANRARELLNARTLFENTRHNMYSESLQSRQISNAFAVEQAKLGETTRHNTAMEVENQRHNFVTEDVQQRSLDWTIKSGTHQIVTNYINSGANLIGAGARMITARSQAKTGVINSVSGLITAGSKGIDSVVQVVKTVLPLLAAG